MKKLPERFPAAKAAPASLAALAARVKASHAAAPGAAPAPDASGAAQASSRTAPFRRLLDRTGLGVLDVAALCVVAVLTFLVLQSHFSKKPPARVAAPTPVAVPEPNKTPPIVLADPGEKPAAPLPEKESAVRPPPVRAVASPITGTPNRPEPNPIQPRPEPAQEPEQLLPAGDDPKATAAVNQALNWLAFHQEADGRWDARKYGGLRVDAAVTGLALHTFLSAGHTPRVGQYATNVKRAVAWLRAHQGADGMITCAEDEGAHRNGGYPAGIALMALAQAAGMDNDPDLRKAAQRAVDHAVLKHQHAGGGWRYTPGIAGDISVSSWFMMGLHAAKVSRLSVPPESIELAVKFLDSVEVKAPGNGGSRYSYIQGSDPNPRRSAIGTYIRQMLGGRRADMQSSVDLFIADGGLPAWGAAGERADFYYWYFGTLSTFQQSGAAWKNWNEALRAALCPNQCTHGDDAGSWDPVGAFASEWGRVGQTALGCLCLEIYCGRPGAQKNDPATPAQAVEAKAAAVIKNAAVQNDLVKKELATKVSFSLVDKTLPQTAEFLSQLTTVKVSVAPEAVNPNMPNINLRVTEMSLNLALDWVCRMSETAYTIKDGGVTIILMEGKQAAPAANDF